MPGRPPKPTKIHILQGTAQKCRMEKRAGELAVVAGMPDPPEWMLPEAHREWGRITAISSYARVLTPVDRALLVVYCQSWARYVESEQPGAKRMGRTEMTNFVSLAGKFGMTPSDRVKVHMPTEEKQSNPFAALGS